MITNRLLAVSLTLLVVCAAPLRAEEELQPTTEWGITITPEQLYDAIQETSDFWPPVRAHLTSEGFSGGDEASRRYAADFIARVNSHFHDRLFGDDEQAALDLFDYLAARLRQFELYRQLRGQINDDALLVDLKAEWERDLRDAHGVPEAARAQRLVELVAEQKRDMTAAGLAPEVIDEAGGTWDRVAQATLRMHSTAAGQAMIRFEKEAKQARLDDAQLIRSVVAAHDWAQITKPAGAMLQRADFQRAWLELDQLENRRTAQRATGAGQ